MASGKPVAGRPALPASLGKYRIDALLGRGGMGEVYKAYDPSLDRMVALKTIRPEFRDDVLLGRFRREGRAAGRLRHPRIVTVYDLGEVEGTVFMAMEYLEGRSLASAMQDGNLTFDARVRVLLELLDGLSYAHQNEVIHRDIKPANVQVLPDSSIKILDFGVARLASAESVSHTAAVAATPISRSQPALYPERELDSAGGSVNDLAFSPDNRLLVAANQSGSLVIWDAQTGTLIRRVPVASSALARVAFGSEGNLVAAGAEDGRLFVLDLRTGLSREVVRHPRPVTAVALSADGTVGASGDADGGLVLWDAAEAGLGPLQERGASKGIFYLAFDARGFLLSLSRDLRVVTWDVAGRRAVRRGTLQFETTGKTAVPDSATIDPGASTLAISTQYVITPRGGALTSRAGLAHPEDLRRVNVIVPYEIASGTSADAVGSGDFRPERLALSPGACFAFFTSNSRKQPRLHVWSLVDKGDDIVRTELAEIATALALDSGGGRVAVGLESGRVRSWKTSGIGGADCDTVRRRGHPAPGEPRIALGSEGAPLFPTDSNHRIAVLKFEAGGVEDFLADAVRAMVAGELSNSAGSTVVERSAIESVVRELELQRSGLTAADAVRIGRGLNARKVLFGNVSRFGSGPHGTFVILTRVVDVETQRVEGTRQVTCENCSESDLPRAVEVLRRSIIP